MNILKKIAVLTVLTSLTVPALALADEYGDEKAPDFGKWRFMLGAEAYYDNYKERSVGVDEDAGFGAIDVGATYDFDLAFIEWTNRASYGRDHYSDTTDGNASGIPQWEFESRLKVGTNMYFGDVAITPYTGIGGRYFMDNSKNVVTSLGYWGYNRRIGQLYMPYGVTVATPISDSLTIVPTIEYDELMRGHVNSRMAYLGPGNYDVSNYQKKGYGIRGEIMFTPSYKDDNSTDISSANWAVGPFVRYWHIKDSNTTTDPSTTYWTEPNNLRLQAGITAKIYW